MSDIYLQITETPTVVTLSAPVVSGALASTVTVANTVTVALDSNSLSALENVTVTVGAAITGTVTVSNFPATQTVAGTVTANLSAIYAGEAPFTQLDNPMMAVGGLLDGFNEIRPIRIDFNTGGQIVAGTVTANLGSPLPAGTNRIGVVTIGGGTVTIGAGISQIGSVTASISGTVPISISSVTIGNSVTIGSLPAISGVVTANINTFPDATTIGEQIAQGFTNYGSFEVAIGGTANVSGTVTANTFALQGTAVTTSNFTSTTASTVLANYNATRQVMTIFNEGAGNLFVCPGATCTTVQYQIRLSSGDYYEVPNHQTTITHSAVFATAGTARVTQVS